MSRVKLDSLVVDVSFHERSEINPDAVDRYKSLYIQREGKGPSLKVQEGTMKIVDGIHRYHAAREAGIEEVYVKYVDVADKDLRAKAYEFNKTHGIPYSTTERNEVIWKLRREDGWTLNEIGNLVNLDFSTVSGIIITLDGQRGYNPEEAATKKETHPVIVRRLLAGETQQTVADDYKVTQPRIATIWGNWKSKAGDLYTSGKMKSEVAEGMGLTIEETDSLLQKLVRDKYEPINFEPVYTSWWPPFGIDKRYGRKWKGNIPAGLVQNILYFYTRPGAHVLDPFAGGGVVMDVCNDMVGRTCEAFDIDPCKEREDIKFHNILDGPPPCEEEPNFIFLDPPYGPIAEGKYTQHNDDLSNMSLDTFLDSIERVFSYWDSGQICLLMCGMRKDGKYTDLPMLLGQRLQNTGWVVLERIVNGIGQTASDSGSWEQRAREERLVLHRHIDIWITEHE